MMDDAQGEDHYNNLLNIEQQGEKDSQRSPSTYTHNIFVVFPGASISVTF